MTWRARSASDKTDEWPLWYLTRDMPADYNETPEAYRLATGKAWPPVLPFTSRETAEAMAEKLNGSAQ